MGSAAGSPTHYLRGYWVSKETEHTLQVQFSVENELAAAVRSLTGVVIVFISQGEKKEARGPRNCSYGQTKVAAPYCCVDDLPLSEGNDSVMAFTKHIQL